MKAFALGTLLFTLIACNGGNGDGHGDLSHNDLAKNFVANLNLDEDFSVTLAKKSTLENNFIVIYDPLTDSYDALNIDNYATNGDASQYYYDNAARGYFDLDVIPSHYETEYRNELVSDTYYDFYCDCYVTDTYYDYVPYEVYIPTRYRDRHSGLVFEKTTATAKDLAKVAAIKEAAVIQKSAEFLSSEFGLSVARGKDIAKLTNHWKKTTKKGMTAAEGNKYATEILGVSLTKGVQKYKDSLAGDDTAMDSLLEDISSANDITPEHAQQLMTKVFGL